MDKCLQPHANHCRQFSSEFEIIDLFISPKFFYFECHNLWFLGGYIPPENPTKLYDISGINANVHESVISQNHIFFLSKIDLIPFIVANLSQKSEAKYVGIARHAFTKVIWLSLSLLEVFI